MLMLKVTGLLSLCAATLAMPVLETRSHDPSADKDCTAWQKARPTDTCESIVYQRFTTVYQLKIWNPVLDVDDCSSALIVGDDYCVFVPPVPLTVASA